MSSISNLTCPQCFSSLKLVQVSGHYGHPFQVDQCISCGGMWFDQDEYFSINEESVKKLDTLDEYILSLKKAIPDVMVCPKDGTELKGFVDPAFPKDVDVEWCTQCFGMWFNKGEFSELRSKQVNEKNRSKTKNQSVNALIYGSMLIAKEQERYRTQKEVEKVIGNEGAKTTLSYILGAGKVVPKTAWLNIIPILISLYRVYKISDDISAHFTSTQLKQAIQEVSRENISKIE